MRLFIVPQLPVPLRYSDYWYTEFPRAMEPFFDDVILLGDDHLDSFRVDWTDEGLFSSAEAAIKFEVKQIEEYCAYSIKDDDVLFVCDISYPGFFSNILFHSPIKHKFAYCHATSLNYMDIFSPHVETKSLVETAHLQLYDKVFVGSYYHKEKLNKLTDNLQVVRLPFPPFDGRKNLRKCHDIISVARANPQKIDTHLESQIEKYFNLKIKRADQLVSRSEGWEGYFAFVGASKIMLITSREETFGLQVVDAILNDCIPVAPNRYSYPELLPPDYLYEDKAELIHLLLRIMAGELSVPRLKVQGDMKDFYKNIATIMARKARKG